MQSTKRVFTREEAESALLFVRRVARDITKAQEKISDLYDRCWHLESIGEVQKAELINERIQKLLDRRDHWILEIEALGCEYQDSQFGRICFPTDTTTGEGAFCWRPGDDDLQVCSESSSRLFL